MNTDVSAGRRHRPCSVLIALQDQSGLKLYDQSGSGFIVELRKGDILIFAGDCPHNGLASRSAEANYRLFAYFATIESGVPWSTRGCSEAGIATAPFELKGERKSDQSFKKRRIGPLSDDEREIWLDRTDPSLQTFDLCFYKDVLYDRATQTLFNFDPKLWYAGIDTAKDSHPRSRYLTELPSVTRLAYDHCPHFVQEDFRLDAAGPQQKKQIRGLLSKYRKHCPYCVVAS